MSTAPAPVVILISGRGSNLQAILDETRAGNLPVEIRAVISNNPQAAGLQRAMAAGIPTAVVNHRDFPGRADFDRALTAAIDRHAPRLAVLAGFMRILGEDATASPSSTWGGPTRSAMQDRGVSIQKAP